MTETELSARLRELADALKALPTRRALAKAAHALDELARWRPRS